MKRKEVFKRCPARLCLWCRGAAQTVQSPPVGERLPSHCRLTSLLSNFIKLPSVRWRVLPWQADSRLVPAVNMVPGLKLKINERSRRKETDDLLDFTGSKGWSSQTFLSETFVRRLDRLCFGKIDKILDKSCSRLAKFTMTEGRS